MRGADGLMSDNSGAQCGFIVVHDQHHDWLVSVLKAVHIYLNVDIKKLNWENEKILEIVKISRREWRKELISQAILLTRITHSGDVCVFPSLNECDQSCTLTEDGYACTCYDDQFVLNKDNTTCEYIGNTTCVNKTCANGICLKTGETETCICRPGYEELEGNCVDLCSVGHLPEGFCPDNKCESTDSGFRCKCEGKYALSDDEVTCTVRRMCKEGEVGWTTCSQRNALCVDDWTTLEGFTCKCMEGQIAAGNGLCRNVCSIEGNQKACAVLGAECDMDENGDKTCNCPPLFQPFINGTVCNKPAPFSYLLTLPVSTASYRREETAMGRSKRSADLMSVETDVTAIQKDVRKALEKLFPELIHSNILNCNENKDYATCKIEVQFISITEENLKRLKLPDICRASSDMPSECLIPPSLVLRKEVINTVVSVQRTDPCDEDIKENLCGSETYCISLPYTSIFECKCSDGFTTRAIRYPFEDGVSYIESCKDIDECATGNPCQENMECHNILGGYMCSCKSGYRIKDPSRPKTSGCVAICNPNPCVHGDCSALGDNDFECRCSAGYNGKFCDLQDENFKRAKTNTIIVGAVLGGILLIVIIISFAIISRY
ncbi:neurogenic locus notch-like protein 1 [Caerostris extrusa]|uniref:Neurogenic locus notch-like protein 1 n=1 Tax=Caerostris extrusa TaxID=172846 RepID=A0AAV4Q8N7_CAEEX|nr:neurogenic locus notch-like protein 1 [Caerostris extrusa]